MAPRWGWVGLLAALVALALVMAWLDSTVLRPLFPQEPMPSGRRLEFRPPEAPLPLPPADGRRGVVIFRGLGSVGGLFTFWWFLSVGLGATLIALAALVALPKRARRAAEQLRPGTLLLMFLAGVTTLLLGLALSVLLRVGLVLVSLVPFLWGLALLGALFGLAAMSLWAARVLRDRLGPAPPLLAALAALLVLFDVSLVPIAGWVVLGVVAVTSLGLSVLTRVGSSVGWSLEELNF